MFSTLPDNLYDLVPEIGATTGFIDSKIDVDYPHITKTIILLWGSPECLNYIDSLLNYSASKDRNVRQGFPFVVLTELSCVLQEHRRQFPNIHADVTHRIDDAWF